VTGLPVPWRSLRGLGTALTVMFVVDAVAAAVAAYAFARRLLVIEDIQRSGDFTFDLFRRAEEADDFVSTTAVVYLLLLVSTAVVFIVWMSRAARNNDALGRDLPRLSTGWAVGGWFIPIANFVLPVLIVQDLWRGSTASIPRGDMRWRIASRSALVGWWWGTFVLSFLRIGIGDGASETGDLDQLRAADFSGLFGMLLATASAVLAVLVVRRLAGRQEETLRAQQVAWTAAHAGARA
jgi:hypothetical protein